MSARTLQLETARRFQGLNQPAAAEAACRELLAQEPGTYLLTDFLVRSFARTVIQELGLDRHPELREDYFRHYERVVWLVQTTDAQERAELEVLARDAAARIGLPLEVVSTGTAGLDRALVALVRTSQPPHPHT